MLLSFARPEYLSQVLESLAAQTALRDRPIYLFQDNAVNAYSGKRYAEDEDIARSIALFRNKFPASTVMLAEHNLGICENFLRAERFAFEELQSDVAYFFEDDMVLSPHYLTMMDRMWGFVAETPRVGYFAAYGDLAKSKKPKPAFGVQRLAHHWGFGLTRRHWLELHEWLKPYYELVVGRDYRMRPSREIFESFSERGFPVLASSQDGAKKAGTYALGRVSINLVTCFARYIGEQGVHFTPAQFKQHRFDTTVMASAPIEIDAPSERRLAALHAEELEFRKRAAAQKAEPGKKPAASSKAARPAGRGPELIRRLFGDDIYAEPLPRLTADLTTDGKQHRGLAKFLEERKPQIVFDIGVGSGASTIQIARSLHAHSTDGIAVAIDTFLGSPQQWLPDAEPGGQGLAWRNGFPMLYWRFLANVMAAGVKDYIVPVPQTLENAAEILKRLGLCPDLIHWAATGDHRSLRRHLRSYYELLAPGGVVVGRSADANIKRAARDFAEANGLDLNTGRGAWSFEKPA